MISILKISILTFMTCVSANNIYATHATVLNSGTVSCNLTDNPEKEANTCELSSSTRVGNMMFLGDDKNSTHLYAYSLDDLQAQEYKRKILPRFKLFLGNDFQVKKIESSTRFNDWVMVFSAFDRDNDPAYQRAIAFKFNAEKSQPYAMHIIADHNLYKSIRNLLRKDTLKPIKYFKIEASTVVPHPTKKGKHLLLLGIRSVGIDYKDKDMKNLIKIISLPISEKNGKINIGKQVKLIYNNVSINNFGISALNYVSEENAVYMLVTYEKGTVLDGKMLRIKLADLYSQKDPEIIDEISFKGHKPEELTHLSNGKFFVVADEDRDLSDLPDGKRELSEAPFWIIDTKKNK